MFIVIYAILLWIQNFNHRAMEISILQKQFKEQQIQIENLQIQTRQEITVLKRELDMFPIIKKQLEDFKVETYKKIDFLKKTEYFPVSKTFLRGANPMQQYGAEELILIAPGGAPGVKRTNLFNMQSLTQLYNLKRLRIECITPSAYSYCGGYDNSLLEFNDTFSNITTLEIIGDTNFTGNFNSVENLSLMFTQWMTWNPVLFLEKIQTMPNLKSVTLYGDFYSNPYLQIDPNDPHEEWKSRCPLSRDIYNKNDIVVHGCIQKVKDYQQIKKYCSNNGINVTEIDCSGYLYHRPSPLPNILNKMCQSQ